MLLVPEQRCICYSLWHRTVWSLPFLVFAPSSLTYMHEFLCWALDPDNLLKRSFSCGFRLREPLCRWLTRLISAGYGNKNQSGLSTEKETHAEWDHLAQRASHSAAWVWFITGGCFLHGHYLSLMFTNCFQFCLYLLRHYSERAVSQFIYGITTLLTFLLPLEWAWNWSNLAIIS